MPTKDPIAAARREAKSRARKGKITHQQALDQIAREAGHDSWAEMARSAVQPTDPILEFVDRLRPNGGLPLDETTLVLTHDAIHGYLAEPAGTDISAYVDAYDFRGDDGDIAPNAFQRDIIESAIEAYVREMSGPDAEDPEQNTEAAMPSDLTEASSSPREAKQVDWKRRNDLYKWTGYQMEQAGERHLQELHGEKHGPYHKIRKLPFDAQMVAQAMDPDGGPWKEAKTHAVRCPMHDDQAPSLVITGRGHDLQMKCMAGCDDGLLHDELMLRLGRTAGRAAMFMKQNDAYKVCAGAGRYQDGLGGRGGAYTLTDGSTHSLDVLTCRMLTEDYPVWIHGNVPRRHYAVETAIRIALAGRHPIEVTQPADTDKGLWRMKISAYRRQGNPRPNINEYHVHVQWSRGIPFGINGVWDGDPSPLDTGPDELLPNPEAVVRRVRELLEKTDSTNPDVIAANKARYERELLYNARHHGTDDDGWGWWCGPNEDEFTWGGPYTTRNYAVSMANGSCSEEGEVFYVIQARTVDDEPDGDGMYQFAETRGLQRYEAT